MVCRVWMRFNYVWKDLKKQTRVLRGAKWYGTADIPGSQSIFKLSLLYIEGIDRFVN